jgi:hypothetical protein
VNDRPTAAELLRDIADLLEGDVLAAVSGPLQHNVRVAGNLARIVQRELELAPVAAEREQRLLADLLRADGTIEELNAQLAERLRAADDPAFARAAWPALLEIARDKLAVNKPGHDAYDFANEQRAR